jgi:hypothetical protein
VTSSPDTVSVQVLDELATLREKVARRQAVDSARGSVAADGLTPTEEYLYDANEYADSRIDVDELVRRAVARHSR